MRRSTSTRTPELRRFALRVTQARVIGALAGRARRRSGTRLHDGGNPFVAHAFLAGLEQHGCLRPRLRLDAAAPALWDGDALVAAAPGLPQGQFARRVRLRPRLGARLRAATARDYFPKWLCAVPYSPVTGPRLLARDDAGAARSCWQRRCSLARASGAVVGARQLPAGSGDVRPSTRAGCARSDVQFHWRNDAGWTRFRRLPRRLQQPQARKNIRAERAQVRARRRRVPRGARRRGQRRRPRRRCTRFYLPDVRREGQPPGADAGFLPPPGTDDAARSWCWCWPQRDGAHDRRRAVPARRRHAVRPLLGRRRDAARPAFRDLLLPGHRLLPARRPARASNPARRASTSSRAASCRRSCAAATGSPTRPSPRRVARLVRGGSAKRVLRYSRRCARAFAVPRAERGTEPMR